MSDLDHLWLLVSTALVLLMQGGFLLLEAGLTRAKNYINVAVKNLADLGLAIVLFWLFGFGIMFGDDWGGVTGLSNFAVDLTTVAPDLTTTFLFQVVFAGTTVTIISGAIAERTSFVGYIGIVTTMAIIYPMFGHWVWGGGWLSGLGFVDFAGSTVVHSIGGWAALAAALIIGPRTGRFNDNGEPTPIRASNLPLAMTGSILLWFGWLGFNGGSVLAFDMTVPGVIAVTVIGGAFGLVASLFAAWMREGYPAPGAPLNGMLAGLVAVTAGAHALPTWAAAVVGAVGGLLALWVEGLLERKGVDDAVGAIPVHLGAGAWGTIAVGIFGRSDTLATDLGLVSQVLVQCLGVAVAGAWGFGGCWIAFRWIDSLSPLRVPVEHELDGLNVAEHREPTAMIELLHHIEYQTRTGAITDPIEVESFTEVGQIAGQFNDLTAQLKGMADIAEKIADGRLDVEVVPRSDEDTFGLAFRRMVGDLRSTVSGLSSTAAELNDSAGAMGALTENIEGGVQTQLADVARGEQSFDEVKTLIDQLEQEVNALAIATDAALQELVDSMDRSRGQTDQEDPDGDDLRAVVQGIALSAREINSVVDVVRSIADTTNLLALNAHIEAEHAGGAAGASFRVVAEEVRGLANETVESVAKIEGQIGDLHRHIEGAVTIVDQVTGRASGLSATFTELTNGVGQSAQRLQQQASNAHAAIRSISEVSTQNADTAAEFRDLADNVKSGAATVGGQLARFET
ncbi:MAG: ammonium transporter [Actinomycetota bacterium]